MAHDDIPLGLTFDDVLLRPAESDILPSMADTSTMLTRGIGLNMATFQVDYDAAGRIVRAEKKVYGETEMRHEYSWSADGRLLRACIVIGDEDPQVVDFPA